MAWSRARIARYAVAAAIAVASSVPTTLAAADVDDAEALARSSRLSLDGPPMASAATAAAPIEFAPPAITIADLPEAPAPVAAPQPDASQAAFLAQFTSAIAERDQLRAEADALRSQRNFCSLLLVACVAAMAAVRWIASSAARPAASAGASVSTKKSTSSRVFVTDRASAVSEPSGGFVMSGKMTTREPNAAIVESAQAPRRERSGGFPKAHLPTAAGSTGHGQGG